MNRQTPRAGEFYKHFKGNLYQIVAVAKDADSMESRVVYQALYGTFQIYDRPLENFMSRVDKKKYPKASQEYRFEQVILEEDEKGRSIVPVRTTITPIYDEGEIPIISAENYPSIENQRKEIEGTKRLNLENHVRGALENHMGEADKNDIRYVDDEGNAFHSRPLTEDEVISGVDPRLIAFLDAETYSEKLEIFNHMREGITEKVISDIVAVLDISPTNGSVEEQYESVRRDLQTFAKFERTTE
ncbi:MAG: DUF1653 domain-containing protein [Lachnospiraceae bacterium]|nr:DUF1653 domain-containing protein [Lachnospiraceae bacterium]